MFLAIFWGGYDSGSGRMPPLFLDLIYKEHPLSDNVAKFHGDRSRELGENLVKEIKKETSRAKQKTSPYYSLNVRFSNFLDLGSGHMAYCRILSLTDLYSYSCCYCYCCCYYYYYVSITCLDFSLQKGGSEIYYYYFV